MVSLVLGQRDRVGTENPCFMSLHKQQNILFQLVTKASQQHNLSIWSQDREPPGTHPLTLYGAAPIKGKLRVSSYFQLSMLVCLDKAVATC